MRSTHNHLLAVALRDLDQFEARLATADEQPLTCQQRIDWLNARMVELGHNPNHGIVAGDGYYYPR